MNKTFVKKELVPLLLRLTLLVGIFVAVALNYDKLVNIDVRSIVDAVPSKVGAVAIAISIFGLKGFTFIIPAMLIYLSVGMAFDTDCNGATVGSILGMRNTIDGIDEYWKKPINGKIHTSLFGSETVDIEKAVELTLEHI